MPINFSDIDMTTTTGDMLKARIQDILGIGRIIHLVALSEKNMLGMRTSKPFVFTQNTNPAEQSDGLNDGDHILLFPQDEEGLCPHSWINAAYPFLEKFRSNFSFFPLEAEMYYNITIIGMPKGNRFGVSEKIENELKSASWRKVTRINCSNAKELEKALNKRIKANKAFLED